MNSDVKIKDNILIGMSRLLAPTRESERKLRFRNKRREVTIYYFSNPLIDAKKLRGDWTKVGNQIRQASTTILENCDSED